MSQVFLQLVVASWGVVSMFPKIVNNLALGAVQKMLDARDIILPSTNCILEAVKNCLRNNHSVFSGKHYLQIHGTAMGPKMLVVMQIWLWEK